MCEKCKSSPEDIDAAVERIEAARKAITVALWPALADPSVTNPDFSPSTTLDLAHILRHFIDAAEFVTTGLRRMVIDMLLDDMQRQTQEDLLDQLKDAIAASGGEAAVVDRAKVASLVEWMRSTADGTDMPPLEDADVKSVPGMYL